MAALGPRRRIAGGRWMITGASGGLGGALARRLEQRPGVEVLRLDRSPAEAPEHHHVRADLSTADGLADARAAVRDWKPDVLVSCAALAHPSAMLDASPELVEEMLAVDFRAPMELMLEVARLGKPASVVNIVSPFRLAGVRKQSMYCITKAALSRAGEALSMELDRAAGFTVVDVVPGVFNTGIRPTNDLDTWVVRGYRKVARTPDGVARELLFRLDRGTYRRHRTIRLGWDGPAIELAGRVLPNDVWIPFVNRISGQRIADAPPEQAPEEAVTSRSG